MLRTPSFHAVARVRRAILPEVSRSAQERAQLIFPAQIGHPIRPATHTARLPGMTGRRGHQLHGLPEQLRESKLLTRTRSVTGAPQAEPGQIEVASGGVPF
jgi:hypothetical protein